ncbi:MAG: ribosomal protein S18-alanine N-acetyltransferase, partial [Methermicoccaceae archaeon]
SFEGHRPQDYIEYYLATRGHIFVADCGVVVGYVAGTLFNEKGKVLSIAVHPYFRGMGVGRKLLKVLLTALFEEGATKVILEVRESNTPATSMYISVGFKQVGKVQGYYPDGEDAAVFELKAPVLIAPTQFLGEEQIGKPKRKGA